MEVDAGTSIDSLPDELLGRVLALLKDTERLCTAALVCKRWHAAVHTPAFVEAVACSSQFSMRRRSRGKARFASLARWLRRHGGGARRLALAMAIEAPPDSVWRDPLRGLLEACASAGALEELVCAMRAADRYRDPVLLFAVGREWAALTSLRRLDIHGAGSLQADLSPLTRLERLQLRTECEEPVSPGARLPPALTALLLGLAFDQDRRDPYYHPFVLPRQVASVSGSLRSLELAGHSGPVENSSFAVVSCLTGLEELTVRRFSNLPWQLLAALPSLALLRLRLLRLREGEYVKDAPPEGLTPPTIAGALGALPSLESLVVHDVVSGLLFDRPPPAELSRLTRLTHLHWEIYGGGDVDGGLPPGGWCRRVRALAIEERLLHASQGWLEGAEGLEELRIKWAPYPDMRAPGGRDYSAPRWRWFWRWAAAHAPRAAPAGPRRRRARAGRAGGGSGGAAAGPARAGGGGAQFFRGAAERP